MSAAFWIILTGSLVAGSCALLGSFLLLRKMTMLGDAISHSVLPGIVLGFLLSGSRESPAMIFGAAAFGLFSVALIEWGQKKMNLPSDAAIGISFTFLFAVGVILMTLFAGSVDLDLDCVLYGEIAYVSLDTWITDSGLDLGPNKVWISSVMFLASLSFVLLFWKQLRITTFDPGFAQASGISATFWHYSLMGMVAAVVVTSFDSVGAILVVAFLVAPAATAFLVVNRLHYFIFVALCAGIVSAVSGYFIAVYYNASIAGSMAVASGLIFVITLMGTKFFLFRKR